MEYATIVVPHFTLMRIGAAFSSPAISAPAFLTVPHFPVSHFSRPLNAVDVQFANWAGFCMAARFINCLYTCGYHVTQAYTEQ